MSLTSGSHLGPYEILGLIAAGGMGEVYRARDPRLNREAAIKVLPENFTADPDRVRRFEQEARAAGMLNHPNILTIHDVGMANGSVYVVSELLEGETLRQRLAQTGLPIRKAVEYALQIAHGLSAAHDKGITHRDLKPENIFITKDGRVKILDFGLAKLSDPVTSLANEDSKLQTIDGGTEPGLVLGTIGYMAPEQVRGLSADHRSDIFTFGVILYEMLTGNRAFHGNSKADTMSAILKEDPPELRSLNKNISPSMENIVRHCLEKSPEERFQSARDLAFDLEMISGISTVTAQEQTLIHEPPKKIPWKVLIPILMITGMLFAFWAGRKSNHPIAKSTSAFSPTEKYFQRLTNLAGEELFPSIAPDGKSFVYVARVNANLHIFFSRVGGQKPIDLTEGSDVDNTQPVFSPDGQEIAFRSEREGGGIFLMGATGESVKRVSDSGGNPSWSPDGKEIVYAVEGVSDPLGRGLTSQIWAIRVSSGEKRLIAKGDAVQPSWSPKGSRVAFWGLRGDSGQRDIWTVDAGGKTEPVTVTDDAPTDWNPFWSPDGKYLYFVSDRGGTMNLWRVNIDESSGKTTGKPESVTTPTGWTQHVSVAANGEMIFSALDRRTLLRKIEFDPQTAKTRGGVETILTSGDPFLTTELSPDGNWIAWATQWPQRDIYVGRSDGSEIRRLTDDADMDRYPNWSPDGKDIIFMSDRTGKYDFWMIHSDGSGLRKATETTGKVVGAWTPRFSPNGSFLSVSNGNGVFIFDTRKALPWKNPTPLPAYPDCACRFEGHLWSPDNKKLFGTIVTAENIGTKAVAHYSFESQHYETFPLPYVPQEAGMSWITPGKLLIATQGNHLLTLDVLTKKVDEVSLPPGLSLLNAEFSDIGKTIILRSETTESDIWLMKPATQ